VRGAASLRIKPDGVSFSLGVETRAAVVTDAFNTNARKVAAVLDALKQKGVAAEELQTSNLDVSSVTSDSGKPAGFRVSNLVTVRRRDVESAPALLQAAVAAGANQIGGLRFFIADPTASQKQGLELAFKDARSKAEALASFSAKALGDVVCVSEEAKVSPGPDYARLASLGYIGAPGVEPGAEELPFAVSAVFELK
jgi:uncharacterized protein YggE